MKPIIQAFREPQSLSTTAAGVSRLANPRAHWPHIDRSIEGGYQAQGGARRAFALYDTRSQHFPLLANLFPFAVYNLPRVLRASPDDTSDWRKFRVHGGRVMGTDVSNTDNVNTDSDPEQFGSSYNTAQETWVPNSNGTFYFWLEYGPNSTNGVQARVLFGTDPGANSYSDSNSSPSFPWDHSSPWNTINSWSTWNVQGDLVPDGHHLPIAKITISNSANGAYSVRQYLRSDWLLPPTVPFHYKDYANNCQNMVINVVAFGPASNSNT